VQLIVIKSILRFCVIILPCACLPIPHSVVVAPAIEGVVSSEGAAAVAVDVHRQRRSDGSACAGGELVRTDINGRFQFPALSEVEKYVFFGDTFYFWRLGIGSSDRCVEWRGEGGRVRCELGRQCLPEKPAVQ
jgi:hypothetical protein